MNYSHFDLIISTFQTTINDIKEQVDDHTGKNNKLREENLELVGKLTKLIEQYEQREQVRISKCIQ